MFMKKLFNISRIKILICAILTITTALTFSGCTPVKNILDSLYGDKLVETAESIPYIAFSNDDGENTLENITLSVDEFSKYSVIDESFRSSLGYETLTEKQQVIYKALEYAMEKGYTNIFFDSKIASNQEELIKILFYLSFDSPLLEQNFRYGVGTFSDNYAVPVLGLYEREATFEGYYISVFNFTKELWDKKQEAIEKAKTIVSELPENLSEFEKANRLYNYITENIDYITYENLGDNTTVYSFLYDALITGKTNCDGYSNALALLYRLANIENAEKISKTEPEFDEEHTWNIFRADGKWYNSDATESTLTNKSEKVYKKLNFAFSDELQTYKHEYSEIYPECIQNPNLPIDAKLPDASPNEFTKTVKEAFKTHQNKFAFILIDTCNEKQLNSALQRTADNLNRNLDSVYFECSNGKTALYVY